VAIAFSMSIRLPKAKFLPVHARGDRCYHIETKKRQSFRGPAVGLDVCKPVGLTELMCNSSIACIFGIDYPMSVMFTSGANEKERHLGAPACHTGMLKGTN
jgi:hypothetical protein